MTPSDRLDVMLRADFHRADELYVDSRYDAVLARSTQRTRRRRAFFAATAAAFVIGAIGSVALIRPQLDPPATNQPAAALDGSWGRTVAAEDAGAGAWTLTFAEDNVLEVEGPPDRPARTVTDGASFAVEGDLVRVNLFVNGACDEAQIGTYRWTRDGGLLYLDLVDDNCEAREHLLVGTWLQDAERGM